ncbi:MAG TPA: D-amino-acid transaminase [Nitrospirales bacterium]|nr:D-amino-acid transaminase [Nitrospirales bacterium]
MPDIAFINDVFMPLSEARVSVEDRGFQFGDGVYELIRAYAGRPFCLTEHLDRLEQSARAVAIPVPYTRERWTALVAEAISRSRYPAAKVYIQITRGVAPRDHVLASHVPPTVVITVRDLVPLDPVFYAKGVDIVTVPDLRWARCNVKSVSLLANVLAKQQAREKGAFEALFVRDGYVLEGATSNVAVVRDRVVITPPEGPLLLSGVTRKVMLAVAQQAGVAVKEEPVTEADLYTADELLLTGTTIEVLPVARVNGRPIGAGAPGPVTRLVMDRFRRPRLVSPLLSQG